MARCRFCSAHDRIPPMLRYSQLGRTFLTADSNFLPSGMSVPWNWLMPIRGHPTAPASPPDGCTASGKKGICPVPPSDRENVPPGIQRSVFRDCTSSDPGDIQSFTPLGICTLAFGIHGIPIIGLSLTTSLTSFSR